MEYVSSRYNGVMPDLRGAFPFAVKAVVRFQKPI